MSLALIAGVKQRCSEWAGQSEDLMGATWVMVEVEI